jgi:hypothetical protein
LIGVKGQKVALGGSYSGDTGELFKSLTHDDILQFSLIGREVTLQVKSESLDEIIKTLGKLGVNNISILEWKKCGTTLAGSGCSADDAEILNVSLIPSALGQGLRPLSVTQKMPLERKVYVEMLVNLESVLVDAGVSDVLYAIQVEKEVSKKEYMDAVRDATLNALFNAGGVVGIE